VEDLELKNTSNNREKEEITDPENQTQIWKRNKQWDLKSFLKKRDLKLSFSIRGKKRDLNSFMLLVNNYHGLRI